MTENSDVSFDSKIPGSSTDSSVKPVKSTAVVKYSAFPTPATFAQLQCNTDLKLPPSNWLSTSAESYGLQNVWSRNTGFTSFRMAHMFPDCVGDVDVVSDAENIKKLLKIPYSNATISMMVHQVENTLLLDDFDIYKYLMRQAESDWEWLRKFFYDHVFNNLGDKDKRLFLKANSRHAIQQKNLVSKFLYHSLVSADKKVNDEKPLLSVETLQPVLPEPSQEEKLPDPENNHDFTRNVVWTFENIQMLIGTDMPIFGGQTHPCISLRLRDVSKPINVLTGIDYWLDNLMCNVPEVVMCYHLDGIVQKYELIKTEDLPNLDDAKFCPKVIKDIAQNILSFLKNNATKAGHTYWLFKGKDDDFVKLYDLTSLCDEMSEDKSQNPFTVPVAMLLYRVARNMKYSSDYRRNKRTIQMLLKNCIELLSKEKYPQIVTSAHFMLADLYVPADTDPVNPSFFDQADEDDSQSDCESYPESEKNEDKFEQDVTAAIKCLTLAKIKENYLKDQEIDDFKFKPPPISGSVEERCQSALEHVSSGLECLKYFPTDSKKENKDSSENESTDESEKKKHECDEAISNMAKPFQAIPMPYEPLEKSTLPESTNEETNNSSPEKSSLHKKKNKRKKKQAMEKPLIKLTTPSVAEENQSGKALLCKTESQTLPTWQAPKKDDNRSWSAHLKTLLYEKASLVFAVLAENDYSAKNYGASLRYILAVLQSQKILQTFCGVKNERLISYMLGRAGDCCFMTVQDWTNIEKHRSDYETKNVTENSITDAIFSMEDIDLNNVEVLPERFESLETTLVASYKCYEIALSLEPVEIEKNTLLRRLGNIHNELGVWYMNQAGIRYQQNDNAEFETSDVKVLLDRSLNHLEAGVRAFESVHDEANLALLHSNIGRLMRLRAHANTNKQNGRERHFYSKALTSYQKALQVLGTRKTNPAIWDNVTWDLSTTLYTMATLLQDFPAVGSKTEEELEREVVEIFQKALKYCDTETPGPKQPVYQFRAATIQHRLASLYHKIYREFDPSENDNPRRKNSLQLSRLYYEKAAKLFHALEQTSEFLTVQMERVALAEFQAQISNTLNGKIKSYQNALELVKQCKPIIEVIIERHKGVFNKENKENEEIHKNQEKKEDFKERDEKICDEKKQIEDEERLLILLEQRIQFILKTLTKLCISKNPGNQKKEIENYAVLYKKCYSLTLRSETSEGITLIKHIANVLENIEKILQESKES